MDPQHVVPGNQMMFAGIKDAQPRTDLLAFLQQATQRGGSQAQPQQGGQMGAMSGMMGGGQITSYLMRLHPAPGMYREIYPRRNERHQNWCSRAGDEQSAAPDGV